MLDSVLDRVHVIKKDCTNYFFRDWLDRSMNLPSHRFKINIKKLKRHRLQRKLIWHWYGRVECVFSLASNMHFLEFCFLRFWNVYQLASRRRIGGWLANRCKQRHAVKLLHGLEKIATSFQTISGLHFVFQFTTAVNQPNFVCNCYWLLFDVSWGNRPMKLIVFFVTTGFSIISCQISKNLLPVIHCCVTSPLAVMDISIDDVYYTPESNVVGTKSQVIRLSAFKIFEMNFSDHMW